MSVRFAIVALALLSSVPALAAVDTLESGRLARFRVASGQQGTAKIVFDADDALRIVPDPRCPTPVSLRLLLGSQDTGEIALPCIHWAAKGRGFRYRDRTNAVGGVRTIVVSARKLALDLRGTAYRPGGIGAGPIEVRLTIGGEAYCGRFPTVVARGSSQAIARGPSQPCIGLPPRPNFLVVNLDDARADGVGAMPILQSRMMGEGVQFTDAFTPDPLCCPSRASLLTGRYALTHETRQIDGPIGGADTFRAHGTDHRTIAVWLQSAGYRTGLFGKYLNAYRISSEGGLGPNGSFYVPPGWDRWWAFASPEHFGGVLGADYSIVDEHGVVTRYDDHTSDAQYSTDVSAAKVAELITDAVAEDRPFFAYWTPVASHGGKGLVPNPAVRHFGLFEGMPPWRPPSWDEADVSDKPRWLSATVSNRALLASITDDIRERAYESLLAVDEQLGMLLDLLASLQIDRDTLVLFTSDNGVSWGEHRYFVQNKSCPYEECQRVPMVVRYPRLATGPRTVSGAPALNIDVAPTLAALAGVIPPAVPDGVSLVPWLAGGTPADWRRDYLMESWRDPSRDRLDYSGQPSDGDRIRVFHGDTRAKPRPAVVFEFDGGGGVTPGAITVPIGATADESFRNLGNAVVAHVPSSGMSHLVAVDRLDIQDRSPNPTGLYWWVDVDQGGVMRPAYFMPTYFGVRDVVRGYTWVEYETGERELYDLAADPWQLQNRAGDPAYFSIQTELIQRLAALLALRR